MRSANGPARKAEIDRVMAIAAAKLARMQETIDLARPTAGMPRSRWSRPIAAGDLMDEARDIFDRQVARG